MKKILLTGVRADISEDTVRQVFADIAPISSMTVVRDGDPQRPVVVVELPISTVEAHRLVSKLSDYWLDGSRFTAHLLIR